MPPKIIESTITINAPLSKVWAVLSDFENYHQWNPFTPKIDINPQQIGSTVGLHVRLFPNISKTFLQKEQLLSWEKEHKMEWGIQNAWHVKTVRIQKLTAIDEQTTQYYTLDSFEGPLTWLILLLFKKNIQIGFDEVASGLKRYVER